MTPFWSDNAVTLFNADCRAVLAELEPESVHTCCTSPPYFALRSYKDGDEPVAPVLWADGTTACLGLEPTIAAYLDHLVESFQAVKRVLRSDGTCWVVIGDSYNSGSNFNHDRAGLKGRVGYSEPEKGSRTLLLNLQPLDLCLVPSRLALALQADGWLVRSFIIWSKARSFDPDGAGSVMPESLAGWRWQRHRVKDSEGKWQDCPGCEVCLPNDLLVLRKGSWRPTHAYDVVLMLAKTGSYYSDDVAVREPGAFPSGTRGGKGSGARAGENGVNARPEEYAIYSGTRNLRDCWYITPQPRKEAHFACVDEKTECLTPAGWKRHDELNAGDMVAAFDLQADRATWATAQEVYRYNVRGQEMATVQARCLDMMLTPDHRCVIYRQEPHCKSLILQPPQIVPARRLRRSQRVPVASEWLPTSTQGPHPLLAALVGWYVTEGSAGEDSVTIYQSGTVNPGYCDEIRTLLVRLGAEYTEQSRTRLWRGNPRVSITWRITRGVANELLSLCPGKRLPLDVLLWPEASLLPLWDALMKGDGHFREGGRQTFVQKDKVLIDQVQALGFRLGYATSLRKRSEGTWALYKTVRRYRMLRSETTEVLGRGSYSGVVWCPRTKYGTFVARRNGRVFITGNTYPDKLVETIVKAATSEAGVCGKCGSSFARVISKGDTYEHPARANRNVRNKGDFDGEHYPRRESGLGLVTNSQTLSWRPTCTCNAGEPVPAVVLDCFAGIGTTLLVTRELGRHAVGVEISEGYCAIAAAKLRAQVEQFKRRAEEEARRERDRNMELGV